MGLFEKIFAKQKQKQSINQWFQTFTAYSPVFTSFGGQFYESELVRAAVHARATHLSKLKVTVTGEHTLGDIALQPNEWQTWGQFFYRLSTILDMQNTAFIVPVFNDFEDIVGVYPVLPSRCEVVEFRGEPWLRYHFSNGKTAAIELSSCGIMTKFQYQDDFFGENNAALLPTMNLISVHNQGIEEAVKASASYRFMATMNNFASDEDISKERKRFRKTNLQGEGGLLLFPNTFKDIKQIQSSPYVVDAAQVKTIRENVYYYFGVNEGVLKNEAIGDSWTAFYEGAIEPLAIQCADVLSKMLLSAEERRSGSVLLVTANRLQYMSNKEKTEVSAQMADRGIMNRDEIREIWNLPPLPDGEGQVYTIRGEYYLLNEKNDKEEKDDE